MTGRCHAAFLCQAAIDCSLENLLVAGGKEVSPLQLGVLVLLARPNVSHPHGTYCPKDLAVCTYRDFAIGTEFRNSLARLRDELSGHAGFVPYSSEFGTIVDGCPSAPSAFVV